MRKIYQPRHHSIKYGSSPEKGKSQHGFNHEPVLLDRAITQLAIKDDGIYVDATFGRGGHSKAILKRLGNKGRLFAIDRDPEAAKIAESIKDERLTVKLGAFTKLKGWIIEKNLSGSVDGILLDIGVSSAQLDDPQRGFSFLKDGPLDMRMDQTQGIDAASWINSASKEEIATVLRSYGEERFSKRIANAIVEERVVSPIATTGRLSRIIVDANPHWEKHKHPATRVFQAIRIFINDELHELHECLEQCIDVLAIGGRLVVISFHSLEDRIVKRFIQKHSKGADIPRGIPIRHDQLTVKMKKVGRAIKANDDEISRNPRARSAIMRVAEKIA